jgi:hypothetical protein
MLDLATIHEMAAEAAQEAAQEGREPYEYWDGEPMGPPFHFPFLGDYVPDGWRKRDGDDGDDGDLFADSSGMGADDEAALSVSQLVAEIKRLLCTTPPDKRLGFAVTQAGEFQLYVGVYERDAEVASNPQVNGHARADCDGAK